MSRGWRMGLLALVMGCSAGVAAAAPVVTFSGGDAQVGPGDPLPGSAAAAAALAAAVSGAGGSLTRIDFEGLQRLSIGNGLDLGAGVRLSGDQVHPSSGISDVAFAGTFDTTSGSGQFVWFLSALAGLGETVVSSVRFDFDRPIDAFGAMLTGSNADHALRLSFDDGEAHDLLVPPGDRGAVFFGVRSEGGSFTSVTLTQTWTNGLADGLAYFVGVDDLVFVHAVPLPSTLALAALGAGAAMLLPWRRRRAAGGARRAAAAGLAALGIAAPAAAAPVVDGSTYSLYLRQMADRTEAGGIVFDAAPQHFVHRVTLADGSLQDVDVSVSESQGELADGSWHIRVVLQADADLFPWGNFAGFAYGLRPADPLDLAGRWRLLSNVVTVSAGDQVLASGDWQPSTAALGQVDPWNGFFLSATHFGALIDVLVVGADRLSFDMRVMAVPEPASWALLLAGLAAAGARARRRRVT